VRVALIAMPGGTPRRIYLERGINDFHGTDDARILRRAQAEADQCKSAEVYHRRRWPGCLIRWTVLDRDEALARRGSLRLIRARNADIIAVDAMQPCQFGPGDVEPALNAGVPGIGGLA